MAEHKTITLKKPTDMIVDCPYCSQQKAIGYVIGKVRFTCSKCGNVFDLVGVGAIGDLSKDKVESSIIRDGTIRPTHYGDGEYETYKVINAWNLNFNLGNAVKYCRRAGKKENTKLKDDLLKAKQYIDFELERIENNEKKFAEIIGKPTL